VPSIVEYAIKGVRGFGSLRSLSDLRLPANPSGRIFAAVHHPSASFRARVGRGQLTSPCSREAGS
jgi:hypothetical protein